MNPVDERFEHRLLDRFHYDDRQDGDGYGPDSPRVGDKGWITWENAFTEVSRPFEIVRDEGQYRTGLPVLLVGMEDNYGRDWHIREDDGSEYMSLLEADLEGADLTLMERGYGIACWLSGQGESKPIDLVAPDGETGGRRIRLPGRSRRMADTRFARRETARRRTGRNHHGRAAPHRIPVGGILSIETSITYTTSDGQSFDDRQEAETHEQWLTDEQERREADRQRGWIGRRRYHRFEQPLAEAERKRDAANKEITRLKPLVAGEKNIGKLVDICDDLFYFGREYLDSAKKMEAISQGLEAFAVCRCAKTAGTSTERRRHWQTYITRMARAICMCSLVWKPIGAGTGAGTIGATHCNRHGSVPARHASVSPER